MGVASFSCELGGSSASLLGTGVESFALALGSKAGAGFALGRELALVVSFRVEEGSVVTLAAAGEEATAGEDFWKKDLMDLCFEVEEADAPDLVLMGLAGVRAAALLPAALSLAMISS